MIHVVITRNNTVATTNGNQPPVGIFRLLEERNKKSITRNVDKKTMLVVFFHCQSAWMTM